MDDDHTNFDGLPENDSVLHMIRWLQSVEPSGSPQWPHSVLLLALLQLPPRAPAPPASPTHGEPAPIRRPARWIARDRVGTRSGCAMRTGCRRSRWRSSSSRCSSRSAAAASGSPAAPLRGSEYLCVRTLRSYLAVSSSEQPIIFSQDKRTDPTEMHNLSPRCCRRRTQDTTAMRCGSAHRTVRFALPWR